MEIVYYDLDANPISREEWAELFEDFPGRQIGDTEVGDVRVSTVWLGLDHQYGDGPPLIFETLIMGGELDGEMWRYPTRKDAVAGHDRAVALVSAS